MTRKTGIPSSRQKSIAFGRVHGLSGWPDSVWSGGGPDRSRPVNRRLLTSGLIARKPSGSRQAAPEGGDLLRRVLEQHRRVLPAPPDLHLHLAGTERALADGDAQGAPEELGVGELLPRSGIAIVVEHVQPELLELAVEPVREIPRSSAYCSTAAAAARAGPNPYEPIQMSCSRPDSSR